MASQCLGITITDVSFKEVRITFLSRVHPLHDLQHTRCIVDANALRTVVEPSELRAMTAFMAKHGHETRPAPSIEPALWSSRSLPCDYSARQRLCNEVEQSLRIASLHRMTHPERS